MIFAVSILSKVYQSFCSTKWIHNTEISQSKMYGSSAGKITFACIYGKKSGGEVQENHLSRSLTTASFSNKIKWAEDIKSDLLDSRSEDEYMIRFYCPENCTSTISLVQRVDEL